MTAEQLAEKMYMAWRREYDPTEHPAWGNLSTEERRGWVAAAKVAIAWNEDELAAFERVADECADCGGSTAEGTSDPHVCK